MAKGKKYRFHMDAASAPSVYENSLKINLALNDEFRQHYNTGKKYFSDVFSDLCHKHELKKNNHDIFITIFDSNVFIKNAGYGLIGHSYYFESNPIMGRVPYFQFNTLIDMKDVLNKNQKRDSLTIYLSVLACRVLKEIAEKEGWNIEAVEQIHRDILEFIATRNEDHHSCL